jgi:alkaline phosphatase
LIDGNIQNHQVAGGFLDSGNHTGVMTPIFSYGPGAKEFTGIHENTFFLFKFLTLLALHKETLVKQNMLSVNLNLIIK